MSASTKIPITNTTLDSAVINNQGVLISLAQLLNAAHTLAKYIPETTHIICLCQNRYYFMVAFCATLLKDATNLLPPNKQSGTLEEIATNYPDCICLHDGALIPDTIPSIQINDIELNSTGEPVSAIPAVDKNHIAAIAFTSGSTGKPKANRKTWGILSGTAKKLANRLTQTLTTKPSIIATVPSQHMYGLEMTIMMALYGNCLIDATHPFYPEEIAATLSNNDAPCVLVTTPVHLRALLSAEIDIAAVAKTISATAPLSTELAAQAEDKLQGIVEEIYGFTEAGSTATRRTIAGPVWDLLDGMSLSEKNSSIFVDGDHLPGSTPIQDNINALSSTQFEFLGRSEDMLNVAGKRASLSGLTEKILAIEGVTDAVVFIPPDKQTAGVTRPAAFVVSDLDEQHIRYAIANSIDPVFIPRPLKKVPALPRNATGKLEREKLLALLRQNDA